MTIFAPITAVSASSVIVIRISGDKALQCVKILGGDSKINPNETKYAKIHDQNNDPLDHCMISYFQAPHSFTGDDVVEISLHGSVFIASKVMEILASIDGVRAAQAGEFSKAAFLNNKFDLVQAEAILDLVNSQTKLQHQQALKQLSGDLGEIYDKWRLQIIEILALIESFIDFPDEDIPDDLANQTNEKVAILKSEILSHLDDNKAGQKIKEGLSLAIIGAPNVGKSSLLNFLAKSEVAIVSDIAGTTRDVIDVNLDIAGVAVRISDTAGIRSSSDQIEQEGIKRAVRKAKDADLVILMSDLSQENSQVDSYIENEIADIVNSGEKSIIRVANKSDLGSSSQSVSRTRVSGTENKNEFNLEISLKNQQNLDLLIQKLEEEVRKLIPNVNESLITKQRYRDSLGQALNALEDFNLDKNIELAGEDLRIASHEIGRITGKIEVDNILDVIFSKFCIGK